MRIAIVSDIHANLAAFEAVLAHARAIGYDRMVCLGDVVGYGPDPVECVDLVRELCEFTLLGNHDFASVYEPTRFNPVARRAAYWTRDQVFRTLDATGIAAERARIAERCAGGEFCETTRAVLDKHAADSKGRMDFMFRISPRHILDDRYICVHGSPSSPVNEYLFKEDPEQNSHRLERNFRLLALTGADGKERRASAIVGHTHTPGFILEESDGVFEWVGLPRSMTADLSKPSEWTPGEAEMPPGLRFILNPGSVGQPRDEDPRAAYGLVDTDEERVWVKRVAYDIPAVQQKILAAGLPHLLAYRLALGI